MCANAGKVPQEICERMKFTIQTVRNGCRLGTLGELGKTSNKSVETPMCMLYTRGGSAPHLTQDVLKKIERVPTIAHMYLSSHAEHSDAISALKEGIAKFCGMQDFIVYCSLHDPATEVPSGFNEKSGTAIWTKAGKLKVDVNHYVQMQKGFQPDICQALFDGDTQKDSGKKRISKAIDRSLTFLDQILDKWKDSKTVLFGVIEGGYSEPDRVKSAKETVARNVDGYAIEGFHNNGPKTENFDMKEISNLCQKTLECLPDDKPRILHGVWSPNNVLEAVALGFDIFDSSYPYIVTERGCGLVFSFKPANGTEQNGNNDLPQRFEIDLKNKIYVDDFKPLLAGCSCYCCQNFTRAYINHLLNTSELLSSVLLMIHNFHHYFEFFHQIRQSLQDNSFDRLKDLVVKQIPSENS